MKIWAAVAKLFPVSKLAASKVYQIMRDSMNVRHVQITSTFIIQTDIDSYQETLAETGRQKA